MCCGQEEALMAGCWTAEVFTHGTSLSLEVVGQHKNNFSLFKRIKPIKTCPVVDKLINQVLSTFSFI